MAEPSERDREMADDFTAGGVKLGNRLVAMMIDRDQLATMLAIAREEGRREERERCARKADEDADLHTGGGLGKAARDTANRIAAEIRNA